LHRSCIAIAATRPGIARSYTPDADAQAIYDRVYAVYRSLYELLGRSDVELLHGLKRIYTEGDKIRLQPSNAAMQPIIVPAVTVQVQGRVIGVLRKY